MVDRFFADAALAELYDAFWPVEHRRDLRFYLPLVLSARSVLDVGCGTGALLRTARDLGHDGRLCGVDPGDGMIQQARKRTDIEWRLGSIEQGRWQDDFELVVMTGHAFQVLLDDEDIRSTLIAIRRALTSDGSFAFETRNPALREWEGWTSSAAVEIDVAGQRVRMEPEVDTPFDGKTVSFTLTFTSSQWADSKVSRSTLRFLDADSLASFLEGAGFEIQAQFGDWDRRPLTKDGPEIITIARRGRSR